MDLRLREDVEGTKVDHSNVSDLDEVGRWDVNQFSRVSDLPSVRLIKTSHAVRVCMYCQINCDISQPYHVRVTSRAAK